MVKVRLKGLNIRKSKGKWYVGFRHGGSLIKGFEGSKADLFEYMETPEFMLKLAIARKPMPSFGSGTLGSLIEWYKSETVRWKGLKPSTKDDYEKCFAWIGGDLHYFVDDITTADIAELRNKAAAEKWPRFADKLVSALSAVFSEAAETGRASHNVCSGISRVHKANPDSNREWKPWEQEIAFSTAPDQVLLPMLIARHTGARGSDIHRLKWSAYSNSHLLIEAGKNDEKVTIPLLPQEPLKPVLDGLHRRSVFICTNSHGRPWKTAAVLQKAVGDHLRSLAHDGVVGKGLTLHGLRATFASEFRRLGLDDSVIANLLADKSRRMGQHYTRHVERENSILLAFETKRKKVVQ